MCCYCSNTTLNKQHPPSCIWTTCTNLCATCLMALYLYTDVSRCALALARLLGRTRQPGVFALKLLSVVLRGPGCLTCQRRGRHHRCGSSACRGRTGVYLQAGGKYILRLDINAVPVTGKQKPEPEPEPEPAPQRRGYRSVKGLFLSLLLLPGSARPFQLLER